MHPQITFLQQLDERDLVAGLFTIGSVIPVLVALVTGFRAAAPLRRGAATPSAPTAIGAGALSGLVGGVVVAIFAWLASAFPLRDVLINASPKLVEVLHWGLDATTGSLLLVAGATAMGAAGAALARVAGGVLRRAGALACYRHRVATFSHAVGTVRMGTDRYTSALDAESDVVSPGPSAKVTKNLAVAGRGERLVPNATTDVWAHDGYAYTGTFDSPCGGEPDARGAPRSRA